MTTNFQKASKQKWTLEDLETGELFSTPSQPGHLLMKTGAEEEAFLRYVVVIDSLEDAPDKHCAGTMFSLSNCAPVQRFEQVGTLEVVLA